MAAAVADMVRSVGPDENMLISIVLWLLAGLLAAVVLVVLAVTLATWRIAAKAEELVPACGKFIEVDGTASTMWKKARAGRSSSCTGSALNSTISAARCSDASVLVTI
ncbi:hypothetical protein [Mesorhizobium argentiipisi]|uniref:Uncharacterized protein n=1 Tax=Mesorhizobium argentiipisi TaxID=3015175 RepID=A0ABU8KFT3_9HYPH